MIWQGMHIVVASRIKMPQVAVHATHSSLIMLGVRESHGDFTMTVDAKR